MTNFSGKSLNAACGGMDSRRTSGVAEVSPKYLAEVSMNSVPVGYKQTEVGVIPEDWKCVTLGDVGDIVRGGSPRPAGDSRFFNGDYIPWLTVASLTNIPLSEIYVTETISKLTELGSLQSRTLEEGTLIISNSGATLGVAKILGIKCCANDGVAAVINQKIGGREFLVYYLNTQTKKLHDQVATGNGQPNLNTELIRNIAVPFPSEKEQTAIANALSDVDALISELEKLIAKKQAIKTATMQQLLTGRTRLPQFALREDGTPTNSSGTNLDAGAGGPKGEGQDGLRKGTKPSELGEIPEDWEVGFVGDVCDLLTGFPFPSSKYSDSGVRLLRGSNVKRSCTDWSEEITQYWPEITSSIAQYELKIGDIVISMDGSLVGRSFAQLRESDLPAVLLQRVARLRSVAVSQSYLKEWVCSKFFTEHCDSVKTVTAIPHISPQDIRSFKLLLPPSKEEQTAIATILSDMDEELNALEQHLGKTRQIKQGMMQELLTGRTRLI
jgi:type I restriction enzyme, S subunit